MKSFVLHKILNALYVHCYGSIPKINKGTGGLFLPYFCILSIFDWKIQLQALKKYDMHEWNNGTMEYWRIQIPLFHIFLKF